LRTVDKEAIKHAGKLIKQLPLIANAGKWLSKYAGPVAAGLQVVIGVFETISGHSQDVSAVDNRKKTIMHFSNAVDDIKYNMEKLYLGFWKDSYKEIDESVSNAISELRKKNSNDVDSLQVRRDSLVNVCHICKKLTGEEIS
jgi:hypothetical protein